MAVAYAAQRTGVKATVYVPHGADKSKVQGISALGAEVISAI
jgi:threonine dehydratase